ncbi:DUF998 domain-containing protein [Thalassobius sp. S69A]|uniref:DUF998 domain-containing protein n=1 Tax=unclassified Thalassovita TaxID=2619711 RepID=UPI003C79A3F0
MSALRLRGAAGILRGMAFNSKQMPETESRPGGLVMFWLFALLFAADMAVPLVLGPYYPGYSHLHDTLSTLGHRHSPVFGIIAVWLVFFGVALCVLTFWSGLRAGQDRKHRIFSAGLLAFAMGAGIVAGLFPEDLPGEAETLNGKLHGIGAGLGSLGLLAGLMAGAVAGSVAGARKLALGLSLVACAGFAVFLGSKGPQMYAGLWQKLYLGAAYLAVLVIVRAGLSAGGRTDR